MKRNVSVEEISDGHFYRASDLVKIGTGGCRNCHDCCSMGPVILLDPYDVYDYSDPEDYYFDWEDDFEDYEDAEDYWDSAWD